jgi:hypothetical protein
MKKDTKTEPLQFERPRIKCKSWVTLNPRPENIKPDWIVFNAPRPLIGNEEWQGEYRHGIFYVAVDPCVDEHSERIIKHNVDLDGWAVVYVAKSEFEAWKNSVLKEYGVAPEDADETIQESLLQQFFRDGWGKEIEV